MQRIQAQIAVSVSELKKSPSSVLEQAHGEAVAVLNHNRVMAYMVPANTYEAMIERLDDIELVKIIKQREDEKPVRVKV